MFTLKLSVGYHLNYRQCALTDNKKAVLLPGEPRDAAENFDTYRILQWHRAVSLPQPIAQLSCMHQ